MIDSYHSLDNYENILKMKETEDFNERFFLNVKESNKSHFVGIEDPTK